MVCIHWHVLSWKKVYPKKYAHGFGVFFLCIVFSFLVYASDVYTHIINACFTGIEIDPIQMK